MASREELKSAIKEVFAEEKKSWLDELMTAAGTKKKRASDMSEDDLKETISTLVADALKNMAPKKGWL
jgi:cation transport regulator ChaB